MNHGMVYRYEGRRAAILGIGKAVPVHEFQQKSFCEYYFEISRSNHMVDLKAKFANLCKSVYIYIVLL